MSASDTTSVDSASTPPSGYVRAIGDLGFTLDTLRSYAVPPAPPAWVCLPSFGYVDNTTALSIVDTTAGFAWTEGIICAANPDSVADSVARAVFSAVARTDTVPLVAAFSDTPSDYNFAFSWFGSTLALTGQWSDPGDSVMTGISAALILPDGHVLTGDWSGRPITSATPSAERLVIRQIPTGQRPGR